MSRPGERAAAAPPPFDARELIASLPHRPGVYRMFDAGGATLYVGKARDLKKRVASYFQKGAHETRIALMLAQARNIPQAHEELKAGRWERSRWRGVELHGKTLGLVGLGRVGALVAQRSLAFGMRVIAFDAGMAVCERRGRRERLNALLVGEQAAGAWVLAYQGSAIRVLTAEEAAQTDAALGSLAAALGGLDAIVFTAGIGERDAIVRARVCRHAAWLGIELDEHANDGHGPRISTAASRTAAWVIPTDEELVIARHTRNLLAGG